MRQPTALTREGQEDGWACTTFITCIIYGTHEPAEDIVLWLHVADSIIKTLHSARIVRPRTFIPPVF